MTGHVHGFGDAASARTGSGRLVTALGKRARGAHESMFGLAGHADWYDRVAGRLARPLYRRIAADVAAAGLPGGAFVLDVGTGPGRLPLLIAERCPSVVVEGIDLSEAMIARAARAVTPATSGRVGYRVADVRALPYPDRSIDLAVSSLSLHHWTDVPAGLAEIRRVLRPDGQAWIYDVRPVLRQVAADATRGNLPVAVEALDHGPSAGVSARLVAAVGGRLLSRLTVRSAGDGVTPSADGPAAD